MRDDCSGSTEVPRRFHRTADLIGRRAFARLRRAAITVVGLGGVGSHAAVALARAGVGELTLVDFDAITATSLNRHAVAGPADVGESKARALADAIARLCPDTRAAPVELFFHDDTARVVLDPPRRPDLVIDAIDSLAPKAALIAGCAARALPTITSLGASARTDPSLVRVDPLDRTRGCPLGKQLRKRLRNRRVDMRPVTAIYSVEPARPPLPPDLDDGWLERGRGRVRHQLPSLPTLPGIFGYAAANAAIERLVGLGGEDEEST